MTNSIPTQLRCPTISGFTVRADFDGGVMSSDCGALLLHGVDRQTGLIERLIERQWLSRDWQDVGQGFDATKGVLQLTGWSRARRVVVLRRRV